MLHAAWNEAVHSRSRAPALERTALEAPASSDNLARQEPREQCVPKLEPRNNVINPRRVKYISRNAHSGLRLATVAQLYVVKGPPRPRSFTLLMWQREMLRSVWFREAKYLALKMLFRRRVEETGLPEISRRRGNPT